MNAEYRKGIKSTVSTDVAKVRFINKSGRLTDIIWINFSGQLVRYKSLQPRQFMDVNTFTNHIWIAVDCTTRDNLHLNRKEVFTVENFKLGSVRNVITQADVRIPVYVTLPLDSLKMCALKVVRDLIRPSQVVNIYRLDLPSTLRADLVKSLFSKLENCNMVCH